MSLFLHRYSCQRGVSIYKEKKHIWNLKGFCDESWLLLESSNRLHPSQQNMFKFLRTDHCIWSCDQMKETLQHFFFKVPTTTIFHMSHNSICQHMPVPLHYPPLLQVSRTPTPAYLPVYPCPQVRVYLYTGNAFASVTGDVTMHATATVPLQLGVGPLGKVSISYILYVYFDTNLCFYYIYIFH